MIYALYKLYMNRFHGQKNNNFYENIFTFKTVYI